jgi:probable rRNA maturation factor
LTGDELSVVVQNAAGNSDAPAASLIEDWACRVITDRAGELVVRIVAEAESALLNESYRGKSGPTNVLAFPVGEMPAAPGEAKPLGDIVICASIVAREAAEQGKPLNAHWAHMVIHGCLHLSGYDHETEAEAAVMEARERVLLAAMGIADPYDCLASQPG